MQTYFARMFRYGAWANQKTIAMVSATRGAHQEAVPLLAHQLAAEHVWLARLEQRQPLHAVWPTLSLEQCQSLAAENDSGYQALSARLYEASLNDTVHYRTSVGKGMQSTVVDILTQVITHGPYHRGQIAKIIARHGGTVLMTDYIMFAREQPALPG